MVKKTLKYPDYPRKKQFKILHKILQNEIPKEENTKKLRNKINNHVIDTYRKIEKISDKQRKLSDQFS